MLLQNLNDIELIIRLKESFMGSQLISSNCLRILVQKIKRSLAL